MSDKIKGFVINLEERIDRKLHIINQFKDKTEFEVSIEKAIKHNVGAVGLWATILRIIEKVDNRRDRCILICEDDHLFTEDYKLETMFELIQKADDLGADILLGGVSYFEDAVQKKPNLFWLSSFTGFQFVIIYERFYKTFQKMTFQNYDNIDLKISEVSTNIYCVFPFISVQKDFGYSDVTKKNNTSGTIEEYFIKSAKRLATLKILKNHFDKLNEVYKNGRA